MKANRYWAGLVAAGILAGLATMSPARDAASDLEPFHVVRIVDFDRKADFLKLTEVDRKALERRLNEEKKVFQQALDQASKTWYEDDKNKGVMFPEAALAPRAILSSEPFNSAEKAAERLNKLLADETEKKEKDEERLRHSFRRLRDYKAEAEKKDRKNRTIERAADLVKARMDELLGAARR